MKKDPVYDRVLFLCIGFGCQKVALKFLIGKLHKAETAFVTLGEN